MIYSRSLFLSPPGFIPVPDALYNPGLVDGVPLVRSWCEPPVAPREQMTAAGW